VVLWVFHGMFVNFIVLDRCNYLRPFVCCFWFDTEGQKDVRDIGKWK